MSAARGDTAPSAIALVPAAGFGTRFHEDGPKALVLLAGKSLLLHALERLAASGRVTRAVIAVPVDHRAAFEKIIAKAPLPCELVDGGVTRRDSVANALAASKAADGDLLCVHDAARPLVDPVEVAAVVDAAAHSGAAIAGFSMTETVKKVQGGKIVETVPRDELVAATTPQVFRADILRKSVLKEGKRHVTDDSELVERNGTKVAVVLTSRWNVKITYPEDLYWAEAYLARGAFVHA
jgi:2-C-methyl-D-erythritol 4-phosphate cytidylyltransferase